MKHASRLFGEFEYENEEIIEFPRGILGFSAFHSFVLKEDDKSAPVKWLLSVEDGGPEFAVINPTLLVPSYTIGSLRLTSEIKRVLGEHEKDKLRLFAVVTVPGNVRRMSMNLRTPILINPEKRRGIQYPKPGIEGKPVRYQMYRELVSGDPEDRPGVLLLKRKPHETIEIGDEITVTVLELVDGAVRLSITAPRRIHVSRGEGQVTPSAETKRANDLIDVARLESLMNLYHVRMASEGDLTDAHILKQALPSRDMRAG